MELLTHLEKRDGRSRSRWNVRGVYSTCDAVLPVEYGVTLQSKEGASGPMLEDPGE